MTTTPLRVVRVGPEDWARHRALRLEMLEESPMSFWATLEETRQRTEAQWREELHGPRIHFQARHVDEAGADRADLPPAGGIALLPQGYTDEHVIEPDQSIVVSLWVRPELRGRGVSGPLWAALADHAVELGRPRLLLEVDDSNTAAMASYARIGFEETGVRFPRRGTGTHWVEFAGDARTLRVR